ncbi:hypothetical protein [Streptomyces sp. NPDC007929]|uniref:hypothetical protein n=1 Tax=unclassified Streptomyces TaxID=2593676 RepID=UPI0036E98E38
MPARDGCTAPDSKTAAQPKTPGEDSVLDRATAACEKTGDALTEYLKKVAIGIAAMIAVLGISASSRAHLDAAPGSWRASTRTATRASTWPSRTP